MDEVQQDPTATCIELPRPVAAWLGAWIAIIGITSSPSPGVDVLICFDGGE